ncbi:MAG: thioredoxin [Leifsonia xyli]|nr:MAG: thioredoxin [Leifsonia xyli]
MHPLAALALVVALVALATGAGLAWRAGQGRVRRTRPDAVAIEGVELAPAATLVQFSSEYCTPCRATARVLHEVADASPGVVHVELDVAERPELTARFGILQTPTTLVLDGDGRVRARIGGAVRRDTVTAELAHLLGTPATV